MKGVSEIIAIILILMIVVALAALAYTWFSGIFSSLTATTSNATTSTASAMTTNFRIEIARNVTGATCCNVSVTLRCLGTTPLDLSKISAYVNDVPATIPGLSTLGSLIYGNISTFNITTSAPVFTSGARLRIIAASGLEQSITIT
jgi:flagellin-like protein